MKHFTFDNKWDEIKGKLKQRYGQLLDDDLTFAEGKGEEMLARVRQKLDLSAKELSSVLEDLYDQANGAASKVRTKISEWSDNIRERMHDATDDVKHRASAAADEAKAQAAAAYDYTRDRALNVYDDGRNYVRQNPRTALLAALGAGFVAGLLIRR